MPRRSYRKGRSDTKDVRSCYARTRISADALELLNTEADARGVTISTLLNRLIAGHQRNAPLELPQRRGVSAELIRELCRQGNNLNQIAHAANLSRLPLLEREARALIAAINASLDRIA